jgi:hypothetical protein
MKHAIARFRLAARAVLALCSAPAVAEPQVQTQSIQLPYGEPFRNRVTDTTVSTQSQWVGAFVAPAARYTSSIASTSDTQVSGAGIGSLFWAARNPTQGWRVILPIQPDVESDGSSKVKAWCRAYTRPPIERAACP